MIMIFQRGLMPYRNFSLFCCEWISRWETRIKCSLIFISELFALFCCMYLFIVEIFIWTIKLFYMIHIFFLVKEKKEKKCLDIYIYLHLYTCIKFQNKSCLFYHKLYHFMDIAHWWHVMAVFCIYTYKYIYKQGDF